MASEGFAFGFAGDDIEDEELDEMEVDGKTDSVKVSASDMKSSGPELIPPRTHKLEDLVSFIWT
jgi:hypothetical protein